MAKIKVHELAKELGADKGEIVAYLRAKGYAAMTGVTAVPEGEVENVRSRFGGGKSRTAAREKADAKTGRAEGQEAPKKSKGIVRVFRSHNASAPVQKKARGTDLIDPDSKTPAASPVADKKNEVPSETPKAPVETPSAPVKVVESAPNMTPGRSEPAPAESRDSGHESAAKPEAASVSREKEAAAGSAETREKAAAGSAETREKAAAGSAETRERAAAGSTENREQRAAGSRDGRNAGGRDGRPASAQGAGRDGRAAGGRSDRAPYTGAGRDMRQLI